MSFYNTGNPVPSDDPRDLDDNAKILDDLLTSPDETTPSRLGAPLKTWASITSEASSLPAILAAQQAAISAALAQLAANQAAATANQKPTIAEGLAATSGSGPNNRFFSIPGTGSTYSIQYRNDAGAAVEIGRTASAAVTQEAFSKAESAFALAIPRSLSALMPWAVADKHLRAILGVKASGVAHAILDKLPGLGLLGDYAWAVTDKNKVVLIGVKWSGEVVIFNQASTSSISYPAGPVGGQDIYVLVDGAPYQVTSAGDNFSPAVSSGRISYIQRKGPVSTQTQDLPVAGSIAGFVTLFLHFLSSGQSLGLGSTSAATTLQPPTANRLFTIQDGVRLVTDSGVLTPEMVTPFIPLIAKITESPIVQLTAQLNRQRGLPSNSAALASFHGRGGVGITNLWKGTQPYANAITAVTAAKVECDALGVAYRVPLIQWIHGENDRNSAAGLYASRLIQMQSDYQTDIQAITEQPQGVPILLDQISNWTSYGGTESFVPFDQLQVALDYPTKFLCAGPKYWGVTTDGIHLGAENSMRLGAMHQAPAKAIVNGGAWLPTHCVSATRSGVTVSLKFHTPCGPLVSDVVNIQDPGNWGIRWIDDTASSSVIAVRLEGDNTVIVTLNSVPTGTNPMIGIADIGVAGAAGGPETGPRSCLRDSEGLLDGYGNQINNWACHQRVAVV